MTAAQRTRRIAQQNRERYSRTNGDMLVAASDDGIGVNPSEQPPVIWWNGIDTGGGAHPIGPNGPFGGGTGPALAVVTRATSLIVGPLTAAPFRVQELGYGGKPLGRPRWVTDPCLLRPDSRFPTDVYPAATKLGRAAFWSTWIRDACHFGTGAFLCQEDEQGQPLAGTLRLVNPFLLSTRRVDGALRWVLGAESADAADQVVFDRDGYVQLGPITYRIVALRNPHATTDVDGHTAGVFEQHPSVFRLGSSVDSYAQGTFRAGIPAGYLQVDQSMHSMTQEQADEMKARWMRSHGGDRRSIAVLNAFTKFVPLNLSPVDSALGEVKRLSIADVAFAFALSPETLGVTLSGSATYGNVKAYFEFHRDFGLAPWLSAVEDTLTALLPGTQGVRVDLDRFANPTPKERFDGYAVAIGAGVLTANEARELEGLEPLPEPEPAPVPEQLQQPDEAPVDDSVRSIRPQPWRQTRPM